MIYPTRVATRGNGGNLHEVVVMIYPTRVATRGNGGNLHGGALTLKVHTPLHSNARVGNCILDQNKIIEREVARYKI